MHNENEDQAAAHEISVDFHNMSGIGNSISISQDGSVIDKKDATMDISSVSGYHVTEDNYVTQHKVDQLIVDYIVNGLHSPTLVERPEFQTLISGLQPERTIMSKVCVENIIADNANSFKRQLRDILMEIPHVATTADAWRVYNRYSFFFFFLSISVPSSHTVEV